MRASDTWKCAHCGETVGTYYVTCPYCGYKLDKP